MAKPPIPAAALTKHIGFLGINGSGKTSVCKSAVVEPALEAGERVLAIDPTGVWWGLRLSATGKSKAFPIYIFGGEHGDYPLRKQNAADLAEAFGTSSDSAIFDTSQMTVTERTLFFTEFAEVLLRKNKGPVKLIIDEAHLFMPQSGARGGGLVPDMLHAGNNLVSLGRSKGLRISLISQRPAKLHKDALTQVHSLVAMRLIAPQDRAAVKDWIGDQADPAEGERIIASLPGLAPGEAWVWAPAEGSLERVKFPRPKTFDSSAAPDEADGAGPTLAPINLDALKGKLAKIEEEKKANDPAALRHEIANLKQKLMMQPAADPEAIEKARAAGFDEATKRIRGIIAATAAPLSNALSQINLAVAVCRAAERDFQKIADPPAREASQWTPEEIKQLARPGTPPIVTLRTVKGLELNGRSKLAKAERRILTALLHSKGEASKRKLAVMTGYAISGGGFNNALGRLRSESLIDGSDPIRLTGAGNDAIPDPEPLPTGRALLDHWMSQLGKAERVILQQVAIAYPSAITKETLAERTEYAANGGGFNNALGRLRTLELITGSQDIKASAELFG